MTGYIANAAAEAAALEAAAEAISATHTWAGIPCRLLRVEGPRALVDFGGGRPGEWVRLSALRPSPRKGS